MFFFRVSTSVRADHPIAQEFPPPPPPKARPSAKQPRPTVSAKFKAAPPGLQAQLERMRMQGPPPEPAGQPPRPPVAPPDVKGVPEGSASKARPVGPRAHSKAVSPVGPRAEMRSRSPRTSLFNKAPAEPDATSVPMAAPAPGAS